MARRSSRAGKLSKHWAHIARSPLTNVGGLDPSRITDMLLDWKAAFTIEWEAMTVMRIIGRYSVQLTAPVSDAIAQCGIVVGASNQVPGLIAKPSGVAVNDFTDWMYWDSVHYTTTVPSPNLVQYRFDIRSSRKFDPSRMTLWFVEGQSATAAPDDFKSGFAARILCGS